MVFALFACGLDDGLHGQTAASFHGNLNYHHLTTEGKLNAMIFLMIKVVQIFRCFHE